jgi:putative membrane protein
VVRPLSELFGPEDRKRVDEAVTAAESLSSAEIVPVIASASGRYDRAEDVIGLWLSVAALLLTWSFWPRTGSEPGSWGGFPAWVEVASYVVAVVGAFVLGSLLASRWTGLRRLATPRTQMRDEVLGGARQAFFDQRVHHTTGGTGVLIYVSLHERMAAVLADEAILEKLGETIVEELCRELTLRLRDQSPIDALCATIHLAGSRLREVLPGDSSGNERPNSLVLIEDYPG